MAKSKMVRARDIARLLRVMGELDELPPQRAVRMRRVAEFICHLLGAKLGAVALGDGFISGGRPRHTFAVGAGSIDDGERAIFSRYANSDASVDPCIPQLAIKPHADVTLIRRELVDDAQWYGCAHVNEDRRPAGVDDVIYSMRRLGRSGAAQLMAVHRPWRDKIRFCEQNAILLRLVHMGVASKVDPPKSPWRAARLARELTPRLRQVLCHLLDGKSEPQIAQRLGLSRNTVHGYVKAIYAHFNVGSRAELLTQWVQIEEPLT